MVNALRCAAVAALACFGTVNAFPSYVNCTFGSTRGSGFLIGNKMPLMSNQLSAAIKTDIVTFSQNVGAGQWGFTIQLGAKGAAYINKPGSFTDSNVAECSETSLARFDTGNEANSFTWTAATPADADGDFEFHVCTASTRERLSCQTVKVVGGEVQVPPTASPTPPTKSPTSSPAAPTAPTASGLNGAFTTSALNSLFISSICLALTLLF